jgi:hypothetical protein
VTVGAGEGGGGQSMGGRSELGSINLGERRRNKKEIKRNVEVYFANLVEICKASPCHVSTMTGPLGQKSC